MSKPDDLQKLSSKLNNDLFKGKYLKHNEIMFLSAGKHHISLFLTATRQRLYYFLQNVPDNFHVNSLLPKISDSLWASSFYVVFEQDEIHYPPYHKQAELITNLDGNETKTY